MRKSTRAPPEWDKETYRQDFDYPLQTVRRKHRPTWCFAAPGRWTLLVCEQRHVKIWERRVRGERREKREEETEKGEREWRDRRERRRWSEKRGER